MFKWTKQVEQENSEARWKLISIATREIGDHFAKKSSLDLLKLDTYPCGEFDLPNRYAVYIGLGHLEGFGHVEEEVLGIDFAYEKSEDGKTIAVVTWDGRYSHNSWVREDRQLDSEVEVIEHTHHDLADCQYPKEDDQHVQVD